MKHLFLLFMLLPLVGISQNTTKNTAKTDSKPAASYFTIKGTVINIPHASSVAIGYGSPTGYVSDVVSIVNGKYSYKGKIDDIAQVSLEFSYDDEDTQKEKYETSTNRISLYIQPGVIEITSTDSIGNSQITGTNWQKQYDEISKKAGDMMQEFNDRIEATYPSSERSEEVNTKIRNERKQNYEMINETVFLPYIKQNPTSPVALDALKMYTITNSDPEKIDAAYALLPSSLQNTEVGREVKRKIDALRKTKIGAVAPSFTLPTVKGNNISLQSLRGKYLLLEFTKGIGCPPCIAEIPYLKAAYTNYKYKGFEILSVYSVMKVAKERDLAHVKSDIVKLEMPWLVVYDYIDEPTTSVFKNYGVNAAPTLFLIDPQGKIIAHDEELRGSGMDKILSRYMK